MKNNEEIIRIASELQTTLRQGLIALIENEAPTEMLFPLLEAINRLERAPSDLVERPLSDGLIASEIRVSGLNTNEPASRQQGEEILESLHQVLLLAKAVTNQNRF